MWTWFELGDVKLALADGVVRHAERADFEETAVLLAALRGYAAKSRASAIEAAAAIEGDAQRRADEYLVRAREEAQALLQSSRSQGLEAGELDAVGKWHERHQALMRTQEQEMERLQAVLARIVTTAVERIVKAEPSDLFFDRALREVGELLRNASAASLRVHPLDQAAAETAVARLPGVAQQAMRIEVVADGGLSRGACLFESDLGVLDASLDVQLQALAAAVARSAPPGPPAAADPLEDFGEDSTALDDKLDVERAAP
jgi:type III secretion protein L